MPCYHPIPAHQDVVGGKVILYPKLGAATMELPCGTCLGCRSRRATIWARRCEHEAKSFRENSFVTLTYDEEHVPSDGNLVPRHLQLFLKRLRKRFPQRIRFFACGEYGGSTGRPHYHALLFNCGFSDAVRVGADLFESPTLAALWQYGTHKIGEVTGASANYVARYSLKPVDFRRADADGVERVAPFLRMSRRPGIGASWLASYRSDLRHGFLVSDGVKGPIPRAYVRWLEREDPALFGEIEDKLAHERKRLHDDRLRDGEVIHEEHFWRTQRSL